MLVKMLKALVAASLCSVCLPGQTTAPDAGVKPAVLQRNDGDARERRPRDGVAIASTEFMIKVGPKTNGSKHLLVLTEGLKPGAVIPRHKHHGEDEVILLQTGRAHVWLGDKEYDAEAGGIVFIPAGTWISLKNTGTTDISLFAVWNEPGFEEMLLCGSVPKGQKGDVMNRDAVQHCYHDGDAELEMALAPATKK